MKMTKLRIGILAIALIAVIGTVAAAGIWIYSINNVTVTVHPPRPSAYALTLTALPDAYVGEEMTFTGSLKVYDVGIPSANVLITDGNGAVIIWATTDLNGDFTCGWIPTTADVYVFSASYNAP